MIKSISCSKFQSTPLGKSKWNFFCPVVISSLLSPMCTPIIIMTWLDCCKAFWWFRYVDKVDMLFLWFCFLVCKNYFQLLFVLIILEVWLIVCLGLRFLILFLLLLLHYLLVVVNHLILHHLLMFYHLVLL